MKVTKELFDKLKVLNEAMLDAQGKELLNPVPLYAEVTPRSISLRDQIRAVLRRELSLQAHRQSLETFEESQDFAVDDEVEMPPTAYEMAAEVPIELELDKPPAKEPAQAEPAGPAPVPAPAEPPVKA